MGRFRISGGTVYDPANNVDGVKRDLWIESGRMIEAPADPAIRPERILNAEGCIIFPGGVDMHSHIAGPKVNVARKFRPEDKRTAAPIRRTAVGRSGTVGSVPSTFATGYLYAGMGYTTVVDAAVPPLFARQAHYELNDTPIIDKAFLVLAGNNHYVMDRIREQAPDRLEAYIAWLVNAAKAFGVKIVNPGGVEEWKSNGRRTLSNIDSTVTHFDVTPRQIIGEVAGAVDRLGLSHPVHIHCNNLGTPGNWKTTQETMQALEGRRGHMAHIQYHSYGGGDDEGFSSAAAKLVEYLQKRPEITLDVGHVSFGETTSLTGDGPLGFFLHRVAGNKWFSSDAEMETGCGIVPIAYREGSLVHSIQWATGLEWYLLMDDPWRIALSTDHPNGGTFLKYPQTIRLLMDREYRREIIAAAHPKLRERCVLAELTREYSLNEIAILTRAAPARILGLPHKGHLGPGADADLTIYSRQDDVAAMFAFPRYLVKAGRIIVDDGEIREECFGETMFSTPRYEDAAIAEVREWFEACYSLQFDNYPVAPAEIAKARPINAS